MRAVVTGAGGFVGSALVRALLAKGHQVTAILRRPPERPGDLSFEIGDLGRRLPGRVFSGTDVVFHLAHDMTPGCLRKNVDGTRLWFAQAEEAGLFQIYLSSYSAHPTSPSDYGRAKYELERHFLERGGTVVRPGLVVGNGGMFGRMVATARRFPVFPAVGGELRLFLTGLTDMVGLLAGWELRRAAGVANLFSPDAVRMRALFDGIRRFFGVRGVVVSVPVSLARLALTFGGQLSPALSRYRDSFLALVESQSYQHASSYPALGVGPRSLEEMLAETFTDQSGVA